METGPEDVSHNPETTVVQRLRRKEAGRGEHEDRGDQLTRLTNGPAATRQTGNSNDNANPFKGESIMKAHRNTRVGIVALGMSLMVAGAAQAAPPAGGPPGHAPTEVTGSVAVTNFPASQDVTVSNDVDVKRANRMLKSPQEARWTRL
jgi:hypothetical protein